VRAEYINPFLKASINLFKEYLGLQAVAGKPRLLGDPQDLDAVSAIIGLAGETRGAVVLSFSRETAMRIVSKMAGQEYKMLSNEVIDGVGELINIIAGNAKQDLLDFRIEISLPGVITGNSYKIRWPEGIPVVAIPFTTELGPFTVNVSLKDIA
jgi:Predicted inhibitor of MCP methylation, homolog of CheC